MSDEIKMSDAERFIEDNINLQLKNNLENKPTSILYISGPPGIGKSFLLEHISKKLDMSLNVKYMSTMLIEQISGLPIPVNGDYIWSKPEIFSDKHLRVKSKNPDAPLILFLDDAHLCSKTLQNFMFQLLTLHEIHSHKLPDNVAIILAGNRSVDKAGAQAIMAPIVNRLFFLDVIAESKDWIESFAIPNNIRSDIITFIDKYPELLQSPPMESVSWSSPRSWSLLSDAIDQMEKTNKLSPKDLLQLSKGHIGLEYAMKFVEYVELFSSWDSKKILTKEIPLPDIEKLDSIKSYTLMSSLISEFMKNIRDANYNMGTEQVAQTIIIKEMFDQLQKSCKEIIPLGIRTIVLSESAKNKTAKVYGLLVYNNPVLLGVIKDLLGYENSPLNKVPVIR